MLEVDFIDTLTYMTMTKTLRVSLSDWWDPESFDNFWQEAPTCLANNMHPWPLIMMHSEH